MCWGVMRRTPLAASVTRELLRRDEDHSTELRYLKRVAEGWGYHAGPSASLWTGILERDWGLGLRLYDPKALHLVV